MKVSITDLAALCRIIQGKLGIVFREDQHGRMEKWMQARLKALNTSSREYLYLLDHHDGRQVELNELINLFIVHETFFFRDFDQLNCFAEDCLPLVTDAKAHARDKPVKIWSAGCSTGEEAYTLSIILDVMRQAESWDYRIIATDVDPRALAFAQSGLYASARMALSVPLTYLATYFTKTFKSYQIHSNIRGKIHFECLNLVDDMAMAKMNQFDFIFCKNVLFYFNEKTQEAILNHFFRALNPGGLSTVHGIVKSHHGKIDVVSEPGKGTQFEILLPMFEGVVNETPPADDDAVPRGTEKVMIVDDEELIAKMLKTYLERLGYQVDARIDSRVALAAFKAVPLSYDLVITDMAMPGMTGVELAKEMLGIRSNLPIVLCTGFSDLADAGSTKAMGIRAFLQKPVPTRMLATMMRELLDNDPSSIIGRNNDHGQKIN